LYQDFSAVNPLVQNEVFPLATIQVQAAEELHPLIRALPENLYFRLANRVPGPIMPRETFPMEDSMPRPMCQLNLTLDLPIAESVKRLARERNIPTGRAARFLIEQRLKLEEAGWGPNDRELHELLEQVCSLPEERRGKILKFLKKQDLMPKLVSGSVEGLVENLYFESDAYPFG
jgi:hypothetical protein